MHLYLITGPSGKRYVGITSGAIAERWKKHIRDAVACRSRSALHAAMRKYGVEAFVVEQIGSHETWEQLCSAERAAIEAYGTFRPHGYNLTLGGDGKFGCIPSEETRQKMSKAMSGRIVSDETSARLSSAHAAMSEGAKAVRAKKISEANARRTPEETARIVETISASKRGKKRPLEVIEKVAASLRGKRRSDEVKAQMSASRRGFRHSDESREKMSASAKARSAESMANFLGCRRGVEHSEETRAKMSEAALARREKTAEKMREIWRQRKATQQGGAI